VVVISFRRREQIEPDVFWGVQGKVVQSNARFGLCDRLGVHFDHVRMPALNGKCAEKTKGRSLVTPSAIKRSIVFVQKAILFLANAIIIAVSRVNADPK